MTVWSAATTVRLALLDYPVQVGLADKLDELPHPRLGGLGIDAEFASGPVEQFGIVRPVGGADPGQQRPMAVDVPCSGFFSAISSDSSRRAAARSSPWMNASSGLDSGTAMPVRESSPCT